MPGDRPAILFGMGERTVNYDRIAATFDKRYKSGAGEGQRQIPAALRQLLRSDKPNRILEVGCGTGFWLDSFGTNEAVFGMDLSFGMLSLARRRHPALVCGTAEQL